MTHNFGKVSKKINYRLNSPKIDYVLVSKESQVTASGILNFCYTMPSALLEHFAFKEVLAHKGLQQ
jgi:hypothetical protein